MPRTTNQQLTNFYPRNLWRKFAWDRSIPKPSFSYVAAPIGDGPHVIWITQHHRYLVRIAEIPSTSAVMALLQKVRAASVFSANPEVLGLFICRQADQDSIDRIVENGMRIAVLGGDDRWKYWDDGRHW